MTEYVVFQADGGWIEKARLDAASSKSAIRSYLGSGKAPEDVRGEFVAVPARSWKPVKVQVETALKFS